MSTQEFVLKLLQEGREYFKLALPIITALVGIHMPQPAYMKKPNDDGSKSTDLKS